MPKKTIHIEQQLRYQNTSNDTLNVIYFNDWNHSYSTKKTPLAQRFTEEFSTRFHFAKKEERGFTDIISIKATNGNTLPHTRIAQQIDVFSIALTEPLLPGAYSAINLSYSVIVPNDTFTSYGVTDKGEMNLRSWYITSAVYHGEWHYYSNKNLDDLFVPKADINLSVEIPLNYGVYTELDIKNIKQSGTTQTFQFYGNNRVDSKLFLNKFPNFKYVKTDDF